MSSKHFFDLKCHDEKTGKAKTVIITLKVIRLVSPVIMLRKKEEKLLEKMLYLCLWLK